MNSENRSIFRAEAVARYINEQEKTVLPGFFSARRFYILWIVFGVLIVLGIGFGSMEVPMMAYGKGLIISGTNTGRADSKLWSRVIIFFSPKILSHLESGQRMELKIKKQWVALPIVSVASSFQSAAQVKEAYYPHADRISMPENFAAAAVVVSEQGIAANQWDVQKHATVSVRVDMGSRRLASFLPVAGKYFKKQRPLAGK